MSIIEINHRRLGDNCEPFIIAEAGINHNGDINLAKKMIDTAKDVGADAIKFQTFHAEEFILDNTEMYTYQSQGKEVTESMLDMFKRNEFNEDGWHEIKKYCDASGIHFLSTPQNVSDLNILLSLGIDAIKVGSDDFVNIPLIRRYAKENLPMLLSCGMANESEIDRAIEEVKEYGNGDIVLFLCTSQYPTPPADVNERKLTALRERYPDLILGLSDHTQGSTAAVMAVALGATVFEKHFTLDHNLPGPDHWFSCDPKELREWICSIRTAHEMLGSSDLKPTESEEEMRKLAHRSITVVKDIVAGEAFSEDNIAMRRPGDGIPGKDWDSVIGKIAKNDILKGTLLRWEDVVE